MNILFIVPYAPNLIRTRPYNLVRGLRRHGHVITLVTLWENVRELEALHGLEEEGIRVLCGRLTKQRSAWNALGALPTAVPLQAVYCWQPELLPLIAEELASNHFDIVHVEHLRGARYGLWVKSHFPADGTRPGLVWDSVDCISFLFEQAAQRSGSLMGRFVARLELNRTRRYEGWLSQQFDRVLVTSSADQCVLEQLASQSKGGTSSSAETITVLPNGVDLEFFTPMDQPRESDTLVFTGKMSYHANITAALYLVNEIMPRVWQRKPTARLQIVGHRPPRQIIDLAQKYDGRIQVTGTVPDIRPYLAKATLAVVPILYGAGIQNKVLEAMAMETPVVATRKAVSAISVQHDDQILLGDTPDEIAHQIVRLLDDEPLRKQIARHGRCYVELQHDWDLIVKNLEKVYVEVGATGKDA